MNGGGGRAERGGKVPFQRLQHRHSIMKARCYLNEAYNRSCVKNAASGIHRTSQLTGREPKFVMKDERVRGDW